MSKDLHDEIMNIEAKDGSWKGSVAYKCGHRDARHEAAELALTYMAGAAKGGNTSDNITQAAANKAAEEGGRPTDNEEISIGSREFFKLLISLEHEPCLEKRMNVAEFVDSHIDKLLTDRAARPVANKAEVEGIASSEIPEGWPTEIWLNAGDEKLAPFSEYDELSWCSLPQGENDIRYVREDLLATPPATTGASTAIELDAYDAGLLSDFGGGDVNWWQDYIRSELGRAHDFYQSQVEGSVGASTIDEPQERSLKEIMADAGRRRAATNAVFDMLKGDEK